MTAASPAPSRTRWDRLGIWASALCTVHCLLAPLVFLVLPGFAGVWAHPASHALVALVVLPLAWTVLRHGRRGRRWIAAGALAGMGFILSGSVMPYLETGEPAPAERPSPACTACCPRVVDAGAGGPRLVLPSASVVTVIGSVLLIASHVANIIACGRCRGASHACRPVMETDGGPPPA